MMYWCRNRHICLVQHNDCVTLFLILVVPMLLLQQIYVAQSPNLQVNAHHISLQLSQPWACQHDLHVWLRQVACVSCAFKCIISHQYCAKWPYHPSLWLLNSDSVQDSLQCDKMYPSCYGPSMIPPTTALDNLSERQTREQDVCSAYAMFCQASSCTDITKLLRH